MCTDIRITWGEKLRESVIFFIETSNFTGKRIVFSERRIYVDCPKRPVSDSHTKYRKGASLFGDKRRGAERYFHGTKKFS